MPPSPVVMVFAKSKLNVPMRPQAPSGRLSREPPQPHAASSIKVILLSRQIFSISNRLAGVPNICTAITAFVFGVIIFFNESGSKFNVPSMSAHTGIAPDSIIASTVATKVKLCVITSSPGCRSKTASATRSAAVPDVTASACGTPSDFANACSKSRTFHLSCLIASNECLNKTPPC